MSFVREAHYGWRGDDIRFGAKNLQHTNNPAAHLSCTSSATFRGAVRFNFICKTFGCTLVRRSFKIAIKYQLITRRVKLTL